MKQEHIHKEEIAEHNNRYVHKIVRNQYRSQQAFRIIQQIPDFSSEGCFPSSMALKSEGDNEKNAISEAEAKPEASKSTPAKTMAIIAEIEGACTVIPLKISANWHK